MKKGSINSKINQIKALKHYLEFQQIQLFLKRVRTPSRSKGFFSFSWTRIYSRNKDTVKKRKGEPDPVLRTGSSLPCHLQKVYFVA